jgi:hypothetical protein
MMWVKFEFSDGQGKVCKYVTVRLWSVEENVVSYVTSSKWVTELSSWVKYDSEGALQRTSSPWFYSNSPNWKTSGPHHGWCQLLWNYLWFLSASPHKFTAVFMLHKVHGQFFTLQLPLNHLVIWLSMCNGLTTHHPLSLLTNLVNVNHITEIKPDHGYIRTAATLSVWGVGFPIIQKRGE